MVDVELEFSLASFESLAWDLPRFSLDPAINCMEYRANLMIHHKTLERVLDVIGGRGAFGCLSHDEYDYLRAYLRWHDIVEVETGDHSPMAKKDKDFMSALKGEEDVFIKEIEGRNIRTRNGHNLAQLLRDAQNKDTRVSQIGSYLDKMFEARLDCFHHIQVGNPEFLRPFRYYSVDVALEFQNGVYPEFTSVLQDLEGPIFDLEGQIAFGSSENKIKEILENGRVCDYEMRIVGQSDRREFTKKLIDSMGSILRGEMSEDDFRDKDWFPYVRVYDGSNYDYLIWKIARLSIDCEGREDSLYWLFRQRESR